MIINQPSFSAKDYADKGNASTDNKEINLETLRWEMIARNAYNIRYLLKDRGWVFRKEWGEERDVWVLDNLSSAAMRKTTYWAWEQGWRVNGGTLEEHKRHNQGKPL